MSYSGIKKVITNSFNIISQTIVSLTNTSKPHLGAYRSISFFEGSGDIQDQLVALTESIKDGFEIARIEDNYGNLIWPKPVAIALEDSVEQENGTHNVKAKLL